MRVPSVCPVSSNSTNRSVSLAIDDPRFQVKRCQEYCQIFVHASPMTQQIFDAHGRQHFGRLTL